MKKVIFTQEWMSMHPYTKADDVDLYYTNLANKIYDALDKSCFVHQFKDVQDAKYLALCVAAYFEDVISGTCIWKAFTNECMRRYGTYVPFYLKGAAFEKSLAHERDNAIPEYDQDEINIADVKFLLWHHYQQSVFARESVPPLFGSMEVAAKMVYDVLNDEYETAPENARMHEFLCTLPTDESHFYEYRNVLEWFHFGCYFNVYNRQRLMFAYQQLAASGQYNDAVAYSVRQTQLMESRNNLLALSSAEWLARISEMHPEHKLWTEIDYRPARFFSIDKEDGEYVYAKDMLQKDTIKVRKESFAIDNFEQFVKGEKIIVAAMFKFGEAWWLNGIMRELDNNKDTKKAVQEARDGFSHKLAVKDYNLLKEKGYGARLIFANNIGDVKEFFESIGYKSKLPLNQLKDCKDIIIYGTPYTGISLAVNTAACICSPDNPFYDQAIAEENCFNMICSNGGAFPYEIACMLLNSGMLPDANVFTSKYIKDFGREVTQENMQFLIDYHTMGRQDKDLSPQDLW